MNDFIFALRTMRRSPVFAVGAIATLALGMGVNATIFSLASAVLFRPVAGISSPDHVVWVSSLWRDRARSGPNRRTHAE